MAKLGAPRICAFVVAATTLLTLTIYLAVLDELVFSVALVPGLVGAIGLWRGRGWGVLVSLCAAAILVLAIAVSRPWEIIGYFLDLDRWDPITWTDVLAHPLAYLDPSTWLAFPLIAVVTSFGLFVARLFRRDALAASILVFLALLLGLALPVGLACSETVRNLQGSYWEWLGAREARQDVAAGRPTLLGMGMGCGYDDESARRLAVHGIRVRNVACCILPRKHGDRWIGYQQETRRLLDAQRGAGFVDRVLRAEVSSSVSLALRFIGHRCTDGAAITPRYFAGSLELEVGQELEVPEAGIVIGRGRDADVRVASNGVARKHVRVWSVDGGAALMAEDLGSTNGTQANGVTGTSHRLARGDVLTLAGCFDFLVVESRAAR